MVKRKPIKAQDPHERQLSNQKHVEFAEGYQVWVYQFFRASTSPGQGGDDKRESDEEARGSMELPEVSDEVDGVAASGEEGPLEEEDLPETSFVEPQLSVARKERSRV
ncbi:hypothetical protein PC121_g8983 [Phytophthora cactorum]|nr:hypothetical protein PC120_g15786 [Phytophthora cactorum]KAG3072262.1 hypothetical protein PC121_g8983 [Phytophthora cactorum]KAG4048753.1 hypothetical protein PC123_g15938 [Phytophthora cactorum]